MSKYINFEFLKNAVDQQPEIIKVLLDTIESNPEMFTDEFLIEVEDV